MTECLWQCVLNYHAIDAISIFAADKPDFLLLHKFETKDRGTRNIILETGPKLDTFGICLLDDTVGNKIANLKAVPGYKVEDVISKVFRAWLEGVNT